MNVSAINLKDKESFRHWSQVTLRFSDQDSLGHINNCAYTTYIELARVRFLGGLLDLDTHPGINFTLANLSVDYWQEIFFPGTLDVGARVLKLGNKSVTTGYGVFKDGKCVTTATCVNVFFDMSVRKSIVIPEDIRSSLEKDPMQGNTNLN